ncbi:YqgQ family protein [Agrilactobacillus yilanensis]|uniref:YqgQ family protein n=1 Tax=Agrilactobacillus yilanensis TaxID=2485997 RepID=A0ABW4JA43_9LACO|nr:YqgQ family protein [Agrilactobacillus yilanensis]
MDENIRTLYDVQQLLKGYGIFVHLGKRLWDIELMHEELIRIHDARLIEDKVFQTAALVLKREHRYEQAKTDEQL